ncbi:MAG: hypothetical protein U0840_04190 [Gemmataceae bacterium]
MLRVLLLFFASVLMLPLLMFAQPPAEKDKAVKNAPPPPSDPPRLIIRLRMFDYREPSRYWGYGPRLSTYTGLSNLEQSKGEYWNRIQEAALKREKVRQEKLQTERARLEHLAWTRDFQFEQWEKEEKRARERALRTSQQEDTPLPLVLDGSALNILANHLGTLSIPPGTSSVKIPNARQLLAGINFTGSSGGHVGLLRQERTLWPPLLQEDEFADNRTRVEELLKEGRASAARGEITRGLLKDLLLQIESMRNRVIALAQSAGNNPLNSPGQQIAAYRFLNDLKRTANVLGDPVEAKTLLGQTLQAEDVAGLVQHLRTNGLRFGPSTADNRQFYLILHKAMAEESRRRSPSRP